MDIGIYRSEPVLGQDETDAKQGIEAIQLYRIASLYTSTTSAPMVLAPSCCSLPSRPLASMGGLKLP